MSLTSARVSQLSSGVSFDLEAHDAGAGQHFRPSGDSEMEVDEEAERSERRPLVAKGKV